MIAFWILCFCVFLIVYVYALYPLALWVLVRFFHHAALPRLAQDDLLPSVSLIISAYREESGIARKIENSLALDYPASRLQIIIAVDGQEDRTAAIVAEYAGRGVLLSFSPQRVGKVNAIDRAVCAATGEVIVLTDANTYFQPDSLRYLVAPFLDPQIGAVSGAKRVWSEDDPLASSEGLYWKYELFIKKQETRLGSCTAASAEIFALRHSLYKRLPTWVINDDFFFILQVLSRGFRVVYAPRALTFERVSLSPAEETARRSRIVAGRYQAMGKGLHLLPVKSPLLIWQIFSHKFLRPVVPFAMFGALVANLAALLALVKSFSNGQAGPAWLIAWILWLLQLGFYGLALVGSWLKEKYPLGGILKILYLPAFLVNSNLAAVSGLLLFLSGRQSNLWDKATRRSEPHD